MQKYCRALRQNKYLLFKNVYLDLFPSTTRINWTYYTHRVYAVMFDHLFCTQLKTLLKFWYYYTINPKDI